MSWVAAAVVGGSVVGGLISSGAQSDAANTAAGAQTAASQAGIAQQQQFAAIQQLLSPYVTNGTNAQSAQSNLLGLNGNGAQQTAISGLQNSPMFQALQKQGETSILQNASATGGLRGGNTQAALAQYSPQLLNSVIQQQYQNLGGMASLGQNAAAGVGNAGLATGNNITSLYGQIGSSAAGNALAQGNATTGLVNASLGGLGSYIGLKGYNGFGGIGSSSSTGLLGDTSGLLAGLS